MDCKIIKEYIDNESNEKDVNEHMKFCSHCKKYYTYHQLLDNKLEETYAANTSFSTNKSQIMNVIKPKKRRKVFLVAALLLILLSTSFADEVYTFVEEIPLIGDLLKYFDSDDSVQFAIEHDEPVFEFVLEKEGYTLYIKEMVFDDLSYELKFAIESKDGAELNYDWRAVFNGHERKSLANRFKSNSPWHDIYNIRNKGESLLFHIEADIDGRTIIFDEIKIDNDELYIYEPKIIETSSSISGYFGELELYKIEIHPHNMYIYFKPTFKNDINYISFDQLELIDNYGHQYKNNQGSFSSEEYIRYSVGKSIYFDESVSTLELDYNSIDYSKFNEILKTTQTNLDNTTFDYSSVSNYTSFKIKDVAIIDETIDFTIVTSSPRSDWEFPMFSIYNKKPNQLQRVFGEIVVKPYDEQEQRIIYAQLNKWLDVDLHYIKHTSDGIKIVEREDKSDPYYAYKMITKISRLELIELFRLRDIPVPSDAILNFIFMEKPVEIVEVSKIQLEIISGVSFEEIVKSDSAKALICDWLSELYIYRTIEDIEDLLSYIDDSSTLGLGGYTQNKYLEARYSGPYLDSPYVLLGEGDYNSSIKSGEIIIYIKDQIPQK